MGVSEYCRVGVDVVPVDREHIEIAVPIEVAPLESDISECGMALDEDLSFEQSVPPIDGRLRRGRPRLVARRD